MGSGFVESGMNECDGTDVLDELNNVFGDPTSERFKYARAHNDFGEIQNVPGNYKALTLAYLKAGVDVCARWAAYLRKLGKSPEGPQNIYHIARTRYLALSNDIATETTVHQGTVVHAHQGTGASNPSTINSPFPLQ